MEISTPILLLLEGKLAYLSGKQGLKKIHFSI